MEVHHHPHVEKKKFKEYFFEFLMIFLAVSMGFIAENIREHLSDRSKEKRYVINIKKDLATDTAGINDFLPILSSRINQMDTLISMLQLPGPTDRGSDLYYYARLSTRIRRFEATNSTITELKNSGNFRLIANQPVIAGLIKFQKVIDSYIELSDVDKKETDMSYPLLGVLFDASVFNTMIKTGGTDFSIDSTSSIFGNLYRPGGNPQLRNHDPGTINLLIFYLHERKSSFIGEAGILGEQKKDAAALIQVINDEYHLK